MRKKIIIGNWKMNKTSKEADDFFNVITQNWIKESLKFPKNLQIGLAVPTTILQQVVNKKSSIDLIAAQNIHFAQNGSFTGAISAKMIKDAGAKAVIIGHSETRKMLQETNITLNKKIKIALKNKIIPIVCFGETLEQYEKKQTKEILKEAITIVFQNIDNWNNIIIAYEPIWSIGIGKIAPIEYVQQICKFIRKITNNKVLIQYGGSVNKNNIKEIMIQPDIDGVLVGSASLDPNAFMKLLTFNS